MRPTVGSLFAGFGGFDLGFERAGFEVAWQVEKDQYCQRVLAKNFPGAKRLEDVRECGPNNLESVDVICAGFPCQDISGAGKRAGITGERSGLFREVVRTLCLVRHKCALLENVADLLRRGMGRVLGDLAEVGHDAEWDCIPAVAVGAPTIRDRVWILTYPRPESGQPAGWISWGDGRLDLLQEGTHGEAPERREHRELITMVPGVHPRVAADWWAYQSSVARTTHGLSRQLVDDRNGGLGNAVVPQIPELYARALYPLVMAARERAA